MKRLVLSAAIILMFIVPAAFGCEGGASAPDGTGGAQVQDPQEEIGGVEEPDDAESVPVRPDDYRDRADGVDYGKVERISYYSEVAGGTKHATVLMPPDAKEGERYPVLYLLHGLMCDENTWFDLCSAAEIVRNAALFEGAAKMIVVGVNSVVNEDEVAPSMFSEELSEVYDKTGEEIVKVLKPYIDANYPSLTGKWDTAVAGFSMGGREALLSAFRHQDAFGYVGAFSSASFNKSIVSIGVVDPVLDEFVIENAYGGFRYILLNIGKLDFMTSGVTQRYDRMMTDAGIEHDFYLTSGGHDFSTWSDGLHTFVLNIFGSGKSAE